MKSLTVGLEERSYPIIIQQGVLDKIGDALHKNPFAKRYAIVADDHVATLFGERLLASLHNSGIQAEIITFAQGESSKNLGTIAELSSTLARRGFDRKDGLLALGGGVTGDITGFLAACYMRSIPFAQVPTTLLAQVDSSNGLAEVIKYGVIYERDFFKFLEMSRKDILSLDLHVLEDVIARCCKIKAAVVEADEKESDFRRILNFGHTIGHAVEAVSGYKLAHGLAVAMGMVAAAELAVLKGIMERQEKERLAQLIHEFGLPLAIPQEYDRARIQEHFLADKKTIDGKVFFVLPTSIGKVIITDDIEEGMLAKVL
jgi:3-dehydroquinate synthase